MKKRRKYLQLAVLSVIVIATALVVSRQRNTPFIKNTGFVFGTIYNISYQSDQDLQKEIEAELKKVDNSLSTFNPQSVISQINSNKSSNTDDMFREVFNLAQEVSKETEGAFDITVAPMVNAWGFGFKNGKMPNKNQLDSLRNIVGFHKVKLTGDKLIKQSPNVMLDCSAIAKGTAAMLLLSFCQIKA